MTIAAGTMLLACLAGLETVSQIRDNLGIELSVPDWISRQDGKVLVSGWGGGPLPQKQPLFVLKDPGDGSPRLVITTPKRVLSLLENVPRGTHHLAMNGILYGPAAFQRYDPDLLGVSKGGEFFLIDSRLADRATSADERELDGCVSQIRNYPGPDALAFIDFGSVATLPARRSELRGRYRGAPVIFFPLRKKNRLRAIAVVHRLLKGENSPKVHFVTREKALAVAAARYAGGWFTVHLIAPDKAPPAGRRRPVTHKSLAAFRAYLARR